MPVRAYASKIDSEPRSTLKSWSSPIDHQPKPFLIPVARLTRTQGRHGAFRARMLVDHSLLTPGRTLVLTHNDRPLTRLETQVEEFRHQHGRSILKLAGIDSIESAEQWVGGELSTRPSELTPPPEGAFFGFDLENCDVHAGSVKLGTVASVLDFGGTPVLQVDRDGRELLIPFARDYLRRIDVADKRIEVDLPDGLLDVND